jgi:hypothetical protein
MWKKYGRVRQATDDDIIRRMRIAWEINKATHNTRRICNIYCFSMARTGFDDRLHVHCLSYCFLTRLKPADDNTTTPPFGSCITLRLHLPAFVSILLSPANWTFLHSGCYRRRVECGLLLYISIRTQGRMVKDCTWRHETQKLHEVMNAV